MTDGADHSSASGGDKRAGWHWPAVLWLLIAAFVLLEGWWALRAGLNLRQDLWYSTRTIRYTNDLWNAFHLGSGAMRQAERDAKVAPYADVEAGQKPQVAAALRARVGGQGPVRKLSTREVLRGIIHYYDYALSLPQPNQSESGFPYDGLDYLPLRLIISTFWVRQVQQEHPDLSAYPRRPHGRIDTVAPQIEDITLPLVRINTYCEAASAILMFPLVWVWIRRGARAANHGVSAPAGAAWTLPPGLVAFAVATAAFWYAYVGLTAPPPRPMPIVNLVRVIPRGASALVTGTVNSQQNRARWQIQWGTSPAYSRATPLQPMPALLRDVRVRATLQPLPPGQMIHLRLTALTELGSSSTPDLVFKSDGPTVTFDAEPVGGAIWPNWIAALALAALFITMIICARNLPPIHRGWACGLVAAMLVWFDPITLMNSHAWPQWDVWILPFFVLAALLASLNCWLSAGVVLGIGCLSKGQLLLGAPILVLWPLFGGRFGAALRVLSGFALGAALVVWPWILNSAVSRHWLAWFIGATAVYGLATIVIRSVWPRFKPWAISVIKTRHVTFVPRQIAALFILTAAASLIVPTIIVALSRAARLPLAGHWREVTLFVLLLLILPWVVARRSIKFWLAGIFVASIWSAALLYQGDFAWCRLGFAYGSVKQDKTQMGEGSYANLPAQLRQKYQWDLHDPVGNLAVSIGKFAWNQDLDLKTFLAIAYGLTLLLCSAAAAMHDRRNDPRLLIALAAPWLIFPVVMCQTSERYLLWPSALSAAMVAVSLGLSLLHVLLAILATGMMAHQLMQVSGDPGRWPMLYRVFDGVYPDAGWMMLLLAATFLVAALLPGRRRVSSE